MKLYNACKKYGRKAAAVGTGVMALSYEALAALPVGVTTDIATAKTDGTDLAWLLVGLAVGLGILFMLKRKGG